MIGNPRGLEAARECGEPAQVIAIERVGRTERHRDPVHHDRITIAHGGQHFERAATVDHKIFGDDLEPIDRRHRVEHVSIMLAAEAEAEAKTGKIGDVHRARIAMDDSVRQQSPADATVAARRLLRLDVAALLRTIGGTRSHHEALAFAGVLPLARALRTLARALAFATVAADALDVGRTTARSVLGEQRLSHEKQPYGAG